MNKKHELVAQEEAAYAIVLTTDDQGQLLSEKWSSCVDPAESPEEYAAFRFAVTERNEESQEKKDLELRLVAATAGFFFLSLAMGASLMGVSPLVAGGMGLIGVGLGFWGLFQLLGG